MARNRTDVKLRFAGVHLSELKATRRDDYIFDMAHHESFLFHLLGVQDGLLHEINLFHSCGIPIERVNRWRIKKALDDSGSNSPALDALIMLEDDSSRWLNRAAEMRKWSTHRRDVPRAYVRRAAGDVSAYLHDTLLGREIEVDSVDLFAQWLSNMKQLVEELRSKMPGAENG